MIANFGGGAGSHSSLQVAARGSCALGVQRAPRALRTVISRIWTASSAFQGPASATD